MKKSKLKREKQLKRIKELVEEGYSANKIQEILKDEELGMKRQKLLGIIREIKGVKKKKHAKKHIPKKYRKKFLCCEEVAIIFFGYNRVDFTIIDLDKSVSEIYKLIEEYEPEQEYDEIEAKIWASDKKEDKKYKLTFPRLKCLVYLPFARSKNLKMESVNAFIDNLIFQFENQNIYPRKQNLKFLYKVKKILLEKKHEEQLSWREIFEEMEGVETI